MIGLATVTATGLGWRAAQIGSTAAFDDRQSIGETVRVEQQAVQRTVSVAADAEEYAHARDDRRPGETLRPFDPAARERALAAEQSTALDSPAALDPDHWARAAADIRVRVNRLTRWAFVVLIAVLLYTIAEVSTRTRRVYAFAGAGLLVYLCGLAFGLSAGVA